VRLKSSTGLFANANPEVRTFSRGECDANVIRWKNEVIAWASPTSFKIMRMIKGALKNILYITPPASSYLTAYPGCYLLIHSSESFTVDFGEAMYDLGPNGEQKILQRRHAQLVSKNGDLIAELVFS
jgi:hypothetical protein